MTGITDIIGFIINFLDSAGMNMGMISLTLTWTAFTKSFSYFTDIISPSEFINYPLDTTII